ncbi:MAG: Gfo/Idh/MocA family oxidoreductase [Clostridiales Family XIII bacterium]|jgi:predicted dehydrogenase|nr:Gfo/Idh/MocA family oxidoreductase [Clostridiales Family XIII bacterium]
MHDGYRICVVGLGSIGRRHVQNIAAYCARRDGGTPIRIDALRSGVGGVPDAQTAALVGTVYGDADDMPDDYDAIFVTNPTDQHHSTLERLAGKADAFFVEKPVFAQADLNRPLPHVKDPARVYVACPLRYTDVLGYVRQEVDLGSVRAIRAICSSYLPGWRPGADYRKTYSAHAEQGGGVSLDLVHEWDYLRWLFGTPEEIHRIGAKVSGLEVDSEDVAIYIGRYPGRVVELHLDYFGQHTERELRLYTDREVVVADIANNRALHLPSGREKQFPPGHDRMYEREIEYFFNIIEGKAKNWNTMQYAAQTAKLALGRLEE